MVRNVIRHIAVFFAVCFLLLVMLTGAAKIHQSAIRGNMIESAEYMNEKPAAFRVFDRVQSSSLDWYADALLLNIAFNLDENKPLESAMLSAYSGYPNQHAAQYLLESARDGLEPRQEYIRYWHGSVVFVRLYHLLLNIQQIYYFHAIIIFLLTAVLVWILGKNKRIPEAACFLLSMACAGIWFVPFCLEYTWVFLVMLVSSITAADKALKNKYEDMTILFLITGMVTVYLDFLSAETLTLLIPLLLVLRIREGQKRSGNLLFAMKNMILWSIGYVGMWVMKWIIASAVLHMNVMPYVTGHIEERTGGGISRPLPAFFLETLKRNISMLFPFDYGLAGAVLFLAAAILFVFVPIMRGRLGIQEKIKTGQVGLYCLIAVVPYFRYLILCSHAWRHAAFTYRAQAASVLAICFVFMELVKINPRGVSIPGQKKRRKQESKSSLICGNDSRKAVGG